MKLQDLSRQLGMRVEGDENTEISQLASLDAARSGDLTFVVSAKYKDALRHTQASAVLLPSTLANEAPCPYIVCDSPYAAYAQASWILHPECSAAQGVAKTASIDPSANVAASASVGEFAVIGANALVGENSVVGAHCVVGDQVQLGSNTQLMSRVTVEAGCVVGDACRVQSGVVIGGQGFGFAPTSEGWHAIHQVGRVVIGNRVHIGANTTIDRGAINDTEIADGVILDNQIQIAHNVKIGENTAIAGCVGIAGSTVIGRNCQIGGACNIVGHLNIADGVVLNAASTVTQSIEEPGRYGSAVPLMPVSRWRRAFVALSQLDNLAKRVRKLERS